MLAGKQTEARAKKTRRAAALSPKAVYAIRLKNLKALIDERFDGNGAKAAKALGRSHTFLWQLINRARNIGEDTARHVERSFTLETFALDRDEAGSLAQNTKLRILEQYGKELREIWYRLVPEVEITRGLNKKTGRHRPCPITCSEETVYVTATSDSLSPYLKRGEDVFIDKKKTELVAKRVYALQMKGMSDPVLRIAERVDGGGWRWYVLNPGSGDDRVIDGKRVQKVYGCAIYKGQTLDVLE